jgi:hypothetical protein
VGKRKPRAAKSDIVTDFLDKLVANPEALGEFIKHPDDKLKAIPEEHRQEIKNILGLGIAKKFVRVDSYYVQG